MFNSSCCSYKNSKVLSTINTHEKCSFSNKIDTRNLHPALRHFGFDPVDLVSGACSYQQTDFETEGQVPFLWQWMWDSSNAGAGSLGNRVSFSYDEHLETDIEDGVVYHIKSTGEIAEYSWVFEGENLEDLAKRVRLSKKEEAYFLFDREEKKTFHFCQSSQNPDYFYLKKIENTSGFILELFYNEVGQIQEIVDSNKQSFTVDYNQQGFIQSFSANNTLLSKYEYSESGDLITVIDSEGAGVHFAYNQNHLLIERRDKNGMKFHWTYDEFGRVIHTWGDGHVEEGWIEYIEEQGCNLIKDYYGNITKYFYNRYGLVKKIEYPTGGRKLFDHDELFRLTAVQMKTGQVITYTYNEYGWLTTASYNGQTKEIYEYNQYGALTTFIDRAGIHIQYEYDQLGRLKKIVEDNTVIFEGAYEARTNLLTYYIENGKEVQCFYDDTGKISKQEINKNMQLLWKYNSYGKCILKEEKDSDYYKIDKYKYNARQQLIQIEKNGAIEKEYTYNFLGNLIQYKDKGWECQLQYNSLNKISYLKLPNDIELKLTYDFSGKLAKIVKNGTTAYQVERNELRQISKERLSGFGEKRFEYDFVGRTNKIIYGDNSWVLVNHDRGNHIHEVLYSDGNWDNYEYDGLGQIIEAENAFSKIRLTYDKRGNILSESSHLLVSEFEPVFVDYTYTSSGKIESVKNREYFFERTFYGKNQKMQKLLFMDNNLTIETRNFGQEVRQMIGEMEIIKQLDHQGKPENSEITSPNFSEVQNYSIESKNINQTIKNQFNSNIPKDRRGHIILKQTNQSTSRYQYLASNLMQVKIDDGIPEGYIYDSFGRLLLTMSNAVSKVFIWNKNQVSTEFKLEDNRVVETIQWMKDMETGQNFAFIHDHNQISELFYTIPSTKGKIQHILNDKYVLLDGAESEWIQQTIQALPYAGVLTDDKDLYSDSIIKSTLTSFCFDRMTIFMENNSEPLNSSADGHLNKLIDYKSVELRHQMEGLYSPYPILDFIKDIGWKNSYNPVEGLEEFGIRTIEDLKGVDGKRLVENYLSGRRFQKSGVFVKMPKIR
ncbi:hypothetical protein IW492_11415 [Enterococcus sp. BWB1-3]|uniref:DUF6531 domain-containing protein n=1 Tax=Enterococcus sp. BWB1-3 TaxID=2787713 RepID=UPI0019214C97|nr:DUF6531 domain-containing protein [Enterococcus sp. BWB1-3]MBL1229840.1 hypothetical protein [Enterococcus sp. BWB1-3]